MEDEKHFIIACEKYVDIRTDLFSIACANIPGFLSMSENDKFINLLASENEHVTFSLAKYCYLAFKRRL